VAATAAEVAEAAEAEEAAVVAAEHHLQTLLRARGRRARAHAAMQGELVGEDSCEAGRLHLLGWRQGERALSMHPG